MTNNISNRPIFPEKYVAAVLICLSKSSILVFSGWALEKSCRSIGKIKSLMFPPILRYFLSFKFAPRVIERFILSPKSKFDLAIRSVLNTLLFGGPHYTNLQA